MEACVYFVYHRLGMDKRDKLVFFFSDDEHYIKYNKPFFDFFAIPYKEDKKMFGSVYNLCYQCVG